MHPRLKPRTPSAHIFIQLASPTIPATWKQYLLHEAALKAQPPRAAQILAVWSVKFPLAEIELGEARPREAVLDVLDHTCEHERGRCRGR